MAYIKKNELVDVIDTLPKITSLKYRYFQKNDDFFICSLGFEDRNLIIPKGLAQNSKYKSSNVIVFEYITNLEDNKKNEEELLICLNQISSGNIIRINSDEINFSNSLRKILTDAVELKSSKELSITIDISTCSSKIILYFFKIAFEYNINLNLLYTEAENYYPTKEEAKKVLYDIQEKNVEHPTKGISKVYTSQEHPGDNEKSLNDLLILFATFTPERTEKVVSYVNEDLLHTNSEEKNSQIIWVIGDPRLEKNSWRTDYVKEINKIQDVNKSIRISTFNYVETIEKLESIYQEYGNRNHITLSPFGSKLQLVGMAFFYYIRPKCTIVLSTPEKYSAKKYSDGFRRQYVIKFGSLAKMRNILDKIDTVEIKNEDD